MLQSEALHAPGGPACTAPGGGAGVAACAAAAGCPPVVNAIATAHANPDAAMSARARNPLERRFMDVPPEAHAESPACGYFFFTDERYATSASTSSLGKLYCFIAGLRVAFVFSVMLLASVIH